MANSILNIYRPHLFQDVFDWAGEIRRVEISKDGSQFQFRQFIETGMADIHKRLVQRDFLKRLSHKDFAEAAGKIMGDVNYVHPFREGNGRTQLQYLKLLSDRAGHKLDMSQFAGENWIAASQAANNANYEPMVAEIGRVLQLSQERKNRR